MSFLAMNRSRFIAHLASNASVFSYLEEEQDRSRPHVYRFAASMEMGLKISNASEPLRNLLEWLGKKNNVLNQRKESPFQSAKSSWAGQYIQATRRLLPPVLVESLQPLRQLERVASLLLALQRRIGPLLEAVQQKPALRVLLERAGAERQMMAAFADFTAETLGIELAHREIAALAVLIGYEEPTSDKDETIRRVGKWANARQHSKEILEALRQLTGRSPPPMAATGPSQETPAPPGSPSVGSQT